jgi:hypothetical protein
VANAAICSPTISAPLALGFTSPANRSSPPGARVPLEFIGLARQFRTRIAAAHAKAEPAGERLISAFRPRPGFIPIPRHAMIAKLARRWRALPGGNRLSSVIRCAAGKLEIVEMRASPWRLSCPGWEDDELAILLTLRAISLAPPVFSDDSTTFASIGLHALARRYQRSTDRADVAIGRDLLALGQGYGAVVTDGDEICGGEFAIPAAGGGCWIGAAVSEPGRPPLLAVRTFVESRDPHRVPALRPSAPMGV